jgi:hypothetical protein
MHPGWTDTKGVREWMPLFRALTRPVIRTPEQGADTVVWLGSAPEAIQPPGPCGTTPRAPVHLPAWRRLRR